MLSKGGLWKTEMKGQIVVATNALKAPVAPVSGSPEGYPPPGALKVNPLTLDVEERSLPKGLL